MLVGESLWKKIGRVFRGGGDGVGLGTDGASLATTPRAALRRDPREQAIELMEGMQTHFVRQDERAQQLTDSVQQVAGILEQLATVQQAQCDSIKHIAERVTSGAAQTARLAEVLGQLPDALDAQADVTRALGRQLEIAQEADHRVAHSMGHLTQAVDSLRSSAAGQVETLERLHTREQEQRTSLEMLVRAQGRRFLIIAVVAATLTVAALAGLSLAVWALWRQ
jgi:uncharacterized membrane protein YdfJ with MMPL/SSD domain